MMWRYSVYELIDPRTGKSFYVGLTRYTLKERLGMHLSAARTNFNPHYGSVRYIQEMLTDGVTPEINALETIETDSLNPSSHGAHDRERYWIATLYHRGEPLVNARWIPKNA